MPYSGGLTRNIVQCLQDFDIPLYLSHTIVEIQQKRVEKAIVAKVDENRRPIPGTEMEFDVDTILLSVGLIPENELTRQAGIAMDPHTKGAVVYENMETEIPGVFACGNVVHVHDLVDFVSAKAKPPVQPRQLCAKWRDRNRNRSAAGSGGGHWLHRAAAYPAGRRAEKRERIVPCAAQLWAQHHNGALRTKQIAAFKRERLAPGRWSTLRCPKLCCKKRMAR